MAKAPRTSIWDVAWDRLSQEIQAGEAAAGQPGHAIGGGKGAKEEQDQQHVRRQARGVEDHVDADQQHGRKVGDHRRDQQGWP